VCRDRSERREPSFAEQKSLHKLHTIRRPGRFDPFLFATDQNDRIPLRREAPDFRMLFGRRIKVLFPPSAELSSSDPLIVATLDSFLLASRSAHLFAYCAEHATGLSRD
jgi:hypothetical protein